VLALGTTAGSDALLILQLSLAGRQSQRGLALAGRRQDVAKGLRRIHRLVLAGGVDTEASDDDLAVQDPDSMNHGHRQHAPLRNRLHSRSSSALSDEPHAVLHRVPDGRP